MIVTHTAPDLDAIASVWLLRRYGGQALVPVAFVNTGAPDPAVLAQASAVVDTGREYDPARNRFDHHQDAALSSAAMLVWTHLHQGLPRESRYELEIAHEIISLVDAGDRGQPEAGESRRLGLHALYAGGRPDGDDAGSLAWGCQLLDAAMATAMRRAEGRRLLDHSIVYQSADGLLVALRNAPREASAAAFERGARIVAFADYTANAIGVQRAMEWQQPHVGELVETILYTSDTAGPAVRAELAAWFRHPAGFFAGRGTAKAPSAAPIGADLAAIAREIDSWWQR